MPLDVLGRTRATLTRFNEFTTLAERPGNLLKSYRAGD